MRHHPKCKARNGYGLCDRQTPCVKIQQAIDAFNADDRKTHRSRPDSREHYHARWPILADDCDYEVVGFSGVSTRNVQHDEAMQSEVRL
jgi:hypothetical protein